MKTLSLLALCLLCASPVARVYGAAVDHSAQDDYEKSIESVVRHKHFYKAGKFEISGVAGVMPYDSLINHYMLGARLSWHLADHYGWEIADVQKSFPSLTSFTTDLVQLQGHLQSSNGENPGAGFDQLPALSPLRKDPVLRSTGALL